MFWNKLYLHYFLMHALTHALTRFLNYCIHWPVPKYKQMFDILAGVPWEAMATAALGPADPRGHCLGGPLPGGQPRALRHPTAARSLHRGREHADGGECAPDEGGAGEHHS